MTVNQAFTNFVDKLRASLHDTALACLVANDALDLLKLERERAAKVVEKTAVIREWDDDANCTLDYGDQTLEQAACAVRDGTEPGQLGVYSKFDDSPNPQESGATEIAKTEPVKVPDDWMDKIDVWSVELLPSLTIQGNPFGAGLMLRVDRGIPCAEHTQVFSAHSTDTPDQEDVVKAMAERGAEWQTEATVFIEYIRNSKATKDVKEAIAGAFFVDLIGRITDVSYQNYGKRYFENIVS